MHSVGAFSPVMWLCVYSAVRFFSVPQLCGSLDPTCAFCCFLNCFWRLSHINALGKPMWRRLFSRFSCRIFVVWGLPLNSFIHLELIFVWWQVGLQCYLRCFRGQWCGEPTLLPVSFMCPYPKWPLRLFARFWLVGERERGESFFFLSKLCFWWIFNMNLPQIYDFLFSPSL